MNFLEVIESKKLCARAAKDIEILSYEWAGDDEVLHMKVEDIKAYDWYPYGNMKPIKFMKPETTGLSLQEAIKSGKRFICPMGCDEAHEFILSIDGSMVVGCPIESLLVLSPDNKLTININELFNQANKGGEQKIILTRKQIEAAMDKCSHPQVQQARYNSHLQSILKELGFADE